MLKIHLQVFFFKSEKLQGFSSDRKILMSLLSALFHVQKRVLVFKISIFSQDIWRNVHYVLEITSFPKEL